MEPFAPLDFALNQSSPALRELLTQSLRHKSISGFEAPFTRFIAAWARAQGFEIDLWQAAENELTKFPLAQLKHIPLDNRPTLVVKLPAGKKNKAHRRNLMFNAHADVVAAPHSAQWLHDPWAGVEKDGRFFGRGACDVKGPLVSALGAMLALKSVYPAGLPADISLELIPGEEDCVGLGTLTSVVRGHHADACIVLEPTENVPRCASRGGCRFEITATGKAVHGTVKWLGEDAILFMRAALSALELMEKDWSPHADPLFAGYPIARPITVDSIHGGEWQGMVCDQCVCAGYLELLPADAPLLWQQRFTEELAARLRDAGFNPSRLAVQFSEQYGGHRLEPAHPLCQMAQAATQLADQAWEKEGWRAFNSGCEAGLRASLENTPTLVWGPGSLSHAHAVNEFVSFNDVLAVARMFTRLATTWATES